LIAEQGSGHIVRGRAPTDAALSVRQACERGVVSAEPEAKASERRRVTEGGPLIDVEIVFDPSCPWCYIGKRQLERAIALRGNARVVRRWWPFLLSPDMPGEGVDRGRFLIRKFGSEARVARIFRAISHVGQSVGIPFAFERISRAPNTRNAHRLVRFADSWGRADAAVEALFHGHFVLGRDIGDLAVLVDIGRAVGLDPLRLRRYLISDADVAVIAEENARAHRLGINGVPAFVFARSFIVCGAQDPRVLARMLDVGREAGSRGIAETRERLTQGAS
jgi:predicted DsbA family dithiol-disulfide isomerase